MKEIHTNMENCNAFCCTIVLGDQVWYINLYIIHTDIVNSRKIPIHHIQLTYLVTCPSFVSLHNILYTELIIVIHINNTIMNNTRLMVDKYLQRFWEVRAYSVILVYPQLYSLIFWGYWLVVQLCADAIPVSWLSIRRK